MTELHMYRSEDDWVIAHDEADATKLLTEYHGCDIDDLGDIDWKQLDPQESFTLYYDGHPGDDKPGSRRALKEDNYPYWDWKVKAPVEEWIELRGRGWFAGTDY